MTTLMPHPARTGPTRASHAARLPRSAGALGTVATLSSESPRLIVVRPATREDREEVFRSRHAVYASELGQHRVNSTQRLVDPLDAYNQYLVAARGDEVLGFVSITPPPREGHDPREHDSAAVYYSIDKYTGREGLPFPVDGGLWEVRLLTVMPGHRGGAVASLLMVAAMRYIIARGGTRIVAIGRLEVMSLYEKHGLERLGVMFKSGAVSYELMTATTQSLAERLDARREDWQRVSRHVRFDDAIETAATPPLGEEAVGEEEVCYHGGAFFHAIGPDFRTLDRRHEVIAADVLDAPFDPAPAVLEALREHLPWLLKTSPPTQCEGMVEAIARARGVSPQCVVPGAGSSDLIYLALLQWLTAASRTLILEPTYGEYAHVLERVLGCGVERFHLDRDAKYQVDADRLASRVGDKGRPLDLVALVNPNSPTGVHLDRAGLEKVIDALPETTRLWIDETYIEYVDPDGGATCEGLAAEHPRVTVCKSMSKMYALSGVRVAYLIAHRDVARELRQLSPPWAVSLPGQVAAVKALESGDYYREQWRNVGRLREGLASQLRVELGWDVLPGCANFLLCHLPVGGPTAEEVTLRCRERNLFLRDASNMGSTLGTHAIRIAVKDEATNRAMVRVLREVL